ncbi:MAG: AmmeMemoRadiSam system protein A [Bacteroidota bacterium]|nr:AmmeMemoRadiSam system protein A [Bacteroidota bacterium]
MALNNDEKKILLDTARECITAKIEKRDPVLTDIKTLPPSLLLNAGAFVTLNEKKMLRGCIGYIEPLYPLFDTICQASIQAAFHDPRFKPLAKEELAFLDIEISVLYPPYDINGYDDIIIGKHGLILDEPRHRALLLPQVAVEHDMDVHQFLTALCEKAWIAPLEWEKRQLKLKAFETQTFS